MDLFIYPYLVICLECFLSLGAEPKNKLWLLINRVCVNSVQQNIKCGI
jgi:hypothetical protein